MNLNLDYFQFIQKDELRVLTAIEMGMRNHEWVPTKLIEKIAKLKRGNGFKVIQNLLKHKLIAHYNKKYEGYKLHYMGYDYLAISKFKKAGLLESIQMKIGVGKESDIYLVRSKENKLMVLKLARLGRTSFKSIKKNRDYLQDKTHFNWLYLSRIASTKEFKFMEALYENEFPVPVPVAHNRHAILMGFINGFPLSKVKAIENPNIGYNTLIDLIERFAKYGLIHSDFNEFNIMIDNQQRIWVIDFPQMVSTSHNNADFYYNRDVKCINDLFRKKFQYQSNRISKLKDIKQVMNLDSTIKASGFGNKKDQKDLQMIDQYYYDEQIQEKSFENSNEENSEQEEEIKSDKQSDNQNQDKDDEQNLYKIGDQNNQQNAKLMISNQQQIKNLFQKIIYLIFLFFLIFLMQKEIIFNDNKKCQNETIEIVPVEWSQNDKANINEFFRAKTKQEKDIFKNQIFGRNLIGTQYNLNDKKSIIKSYTFKLKRKQFRIDKFF